MTDSDDAEFLKTLEDIAAGRSDPSVVAALLISETVKYRDKVKKDTGDVVTVGDTRVALDALKQHLKGAPLPLGMTERQMGLLNIWINRLQDDQKG